MSTELKIAPQGRKGNNPRAKERLMSFILDKVGEGYEVQERELEIPAREQLAHMVWNALLTGQIRFGQNDTRVLGVEDWMELLKWVYLRVDGQPAQQMLDGANPQLQHNVISVTVYNDEVGRADAGGRSEQKFIEG